MSIPSLHVAAHPADTLPAAAGPEATATAESPAPDATRAEPLLPWVPGPRLVPARASEATPLTGYIDDAATVITARVAELADTAIRYRPPWMTLLGAQPTAPDRAREWRGHADVLTAPVHLGREDSAEPVEAANARHIQSAAPRPAPRMTHEPGRNQHPLPAHRPRAPDVRAPQHRH